VATEPRVHDFTDHARRLPVWVEASPVYELLLGLFSYQAGLDDDHELRALDFFTRIESDASDELKDTLAELSGCGGLWLTLLGIARSAPLPHTVEPFVTHLEQHDAVKLRRQMLVNSGVTKTHNHDEDTVDRAAAGDDEAVVELLANGDAGLRNLLLMDPVATRQHLAGLLRRVHHEVDLQLDSMMPTLERDAAATEALATTMEPAELVERVTNGVTFEPRPGLAGIVLIPSLVVGPWVVISEHDDVRIFSYPVAQEHLNDDPASPPSRLVAIYKALGDERRLRLLYLLGSEARTLKELTEKLDLAKSTTHHHLRILRQAGLVRIIIGDDDKRYELRRDAVPEASELLNTYLQLVLQNQSTPTKKDTP
jgi:DNA-binding transcriptional ArsR family regulator